MAAWRNGNASDYDWVIRRLQVRPLRWSFLGIPASILNDAPEPHVRRRALALRLLSPCHTPSMKQVSQPPSVYPGSLFIKLCAASEVRVSDVLRT